MNFIFIFGPPAVGKMTVGKQIQEKTGIPLFHNHLSIEPILQFFPFGSPPFERLVQSFRQNIFEEVLKSDLPGLSFTCVLDLDNEESLEFMKKTCEFFEDEGANITIVELKTDLSERLIRNKMEIRLLEKPSKCDTDASEKRLLNAEKSHTMNSGGTLPLKYKHVFIDNTNLSAESAANKIIGELDFAR